MSAPLVVHRCPMTLTERRGIEARYPGVCGLCGSPFDTGARIYHLPPSRRGTVKKWVCAPCRFPDPGRRIDLDFVIRKASHRIENGPSYTPSLAEIDVIITAFDAVAGLSVDEYDLGEYFASHWEQKRSPTLGRAKISVLLDVLRRSRPAQD